MPKPVTEHRYAIINPYGEFWSDNVYDSPEDAVRSFKAFWGESFHKHIARFKIAMVNHTVTNDDEFEPVSLTEI